MLQFEPPIELASGMCVFTGPNHPSEVDAILLHHAHHPRDEKLNSGRQMATPDSFSRFRGGNFAEIASHATREMGLDGSADIRIVFHPDTNPSVCLLVNYGALAVPVYPP